MNIINAISKLLINTNDLPEVMYNLYNTDDFEIDYDKETIELY